MTDDMQEALSIRYNTSRIVRLTSGNYALFAPWTNAEGMPVVHIGSLSDMADLIPTAIECAEWVDSITPVHEARESKINLAQALGITRPVVKIERRL